MKIGFNLLVVFQFCLLSVAWGQDDSSAVQAPAQPKKDTSVVLDTPKPPAPKKKIPFRPSVPKDSAIAAKDSSARTKVDSSHFQNQPAKDSLGANTASRPAVIPPPPVRAPELPVQKRVLPSKDWLFYIVMVVLLFLALLRMGFSKYFSDMFRIFWHTSFRQKQIRDQLQQAALPSLLFNMFFVLSTGVFTALIIQQADQRVQINHWLLIGICMLFISLIYLAKFFILKLTGWMFGQEEAAETYIFIVFLVNKVMSIVLLPILLILAFADPSWSAISLTLSVLLLIFFLGYRFIRSYTTIRNDLKISQLHFFLYICGFEIVPVLLIYKLLMNLFERTS